MRLRFHSVRSLVLAAVMCVVATAAAQAAVPAPWLAQDIGAPSPGGSSTLNSGTFTVTASGVDIWNASDQFHFVYQQLSGDFEVSARVDSIAYTDEWAKAGVMIRTSLAANAAEVFTGVTPAPGVTFQQRSAAGVNTVSAGFQAGIGAPRWVRLVRAGNTITAYQAVDGATWSRINSITLALGSTLYVGLAVTSHSPGVVTTATLSSVAIKTTTTTTTGVPAPQKAADVGAPAIKGSTTYASGKYTINAGGADIWGTSDQFHYVYQPLSGDGEIIARVAGLGASHSWAKAGVMVRETLAADSRHADVMMTSANGYSFQRRIDPAGVTVSNTGFSGVAPGWVRLVRTGYKFDAYRSTDGQTWTLLASDTVPMADPVYVGLAVTSHNVSLGTTSTIDSLTIKSSSTPPPSNQPPTVALTSPTAGATFIAPGTIALTATASDPENRLSKVDFYAGTTLVGSKTAAPFTASWSSVPAGTYSLTAVASDADGGKTTSAAVSVTVGSTSTAPKQVVFVASVDQSTTLVTGYRMDVFAAGANPSTATPVATSDLGKPTPATNNDITVDRAAFFSGLAAGNYVATVSAYGPGGTTRSTSVTFSR